MNPPTVSVGQEVLYSPHACHQFDKDHRGRHVFHFVHEHDAPNNVVAYKKGDVVQDHAQLGLWQKKENGCIHTAGGHVIRPHKARSSWKAVVREVFADGTVALDIAHPCGGITLHYPDHGASEGLPYDPDGAEHTWHLSSDEKGE